MRIPLRDGEGLLLKHWDHLQYSPLFVQTALYVGTSKCLALASQALSKYPKGIKVFEHIGHHFGSNNSETGKYLAQRHLDALLPYLDQLDDFSLFEIAETAQRLGIPEWSQQHLKGKLDEKWRKRCLPTDEDLRQDLDDFASAADGEWRVRFWLEDADKRHDPKQRILGVVDKWLGSHATIKGLQIAGRCISSIGSRSDLGLLDKYVVDGPEDSLAMIKESTRYFLYRRSLD
jgi:hypothetical protein